MTKLYANDSGTPKLIELESVGSVKTVNGVEPDSNGDVAVDVGVKSVNGATPDSGGNVEVDANPPAISVSATTLAAGSAATVTKSGTDAEPVFTFGIPKGEKGDKGDTGPAGSNGTNAYLSKTGVGAGWYGQSSNSVTTGNRTIYVPYFYVDSYGRITSASSKSVTVYASSTCNQCSDCDNTP